MVRSKEKSFIPDNILHRKFRIILVDDEKGIRKVLTEILDKFPEFEVVGEAENGQKGFELYKMTKPEIVITDDMMPVLSGIDMILKIREIDPDAKIILHSLLIGEEAIQRRKSAGVALTLIKPFSSKEFFNALYAVARGETPNLDP